MKLHRLYAAANSAAAIATLAIGLSLAGCKSTPPAAPEANDATLATALQQRIASDSAIASEPIQTSVQNGIATLNGNVSSEAARALAANDAAQVNGIRTVVNNLTVQTAAQTPPPAPMAQAPEPQRDIHREPAPSKKKPAAAQTPIQPAAQTAANQPQPAPIVRPQPQVAPPPPQPQAPPKPVVRDITIPSGTPIPIRITQTLDSATTQQGETFTGTLATDLVIEGIVAVPQGTPIAGRVSEVHEAAHFKGSSLLTIELTSINPKGDRIPVAADPFSKEGTGRGKNTAEKVGGGAAIGAILGGIFGGGQGAAIGAAAGGGLGAGAQAITKGQQVQIPAETLIRFRLTNPVVVHTTGKPATAPTDPTLQRRPLN